MASDEHDDLRCSFCLKDYLDARKLIAGPNVFICDECVEVCVDIIAADNKAAVAQQPAAPEDVATAPRPQSRCALCGTPVDPTDALSVPEKGLLCSPCVESIGRAVLGRTDSR